MNIYIAIALAVLGAIAGIHVSDMRRRLNNAQKDATNAKNDLDIADIKHEIKDVQDEINKADKDRADALTKLIGGHRPGDGPDAL